MIFETLAVLELMSGIPTEAMLSAPLALGAGMHLSAVNKAKSVTVHETGAWKGMEQKRLLSPGFVDATVLALIFGAVVSAAGMTGFLPGFDGLVSFTS
jgi:hypothetical protein